MKLWAGLWVEVSGHSGCKFNKTLVGPWGLEPQTSTVSILSARMAANRRMRHKCAANQAVDRVFAGVSRVLHYRAFFCFFELLASQFTSQKLVKDVCPEHVSRHCVSAESDVDPGICLSERQL
jgi:hypothetical protein